DGFISSYLWQQTAGPVAVNIALPTASSTTVSGLSVAGVYTFELTVTDNQGATAKASTMVMVNPAPNNPPTTNAGADQTITLPTNSVTITGTASDPNGDALSYLWAKVSGGTATISSPTALTTTVTGLTQGTYIFRLTATDSKGATGSDDMQVVVNAVLSNVPPTANAGADQVVILPKNSTILSGSGNDTDGIIASYAWKKISGGSAVISSPSAAATNITGLKQGTYTFRLTVTDNKGANASDDVIVEVKKQSAQDTTAPAVTVTSPLQGATVSGTTVAIAAEASDNVGVTEVRFVLDYSTNLITMTTAPYAFVGDSTTIADGTHTLQAIAKDAAGNVKTSTAVSFTVNNTAAPVTQAQVTVMSTLNVRDAAPDGTVIGIVDNLTIGNVLEIQNLPDDSVWVKMQFPTITGWVSAKYLKQL
ncbi:MAG TPA: Ig-like domain-containing protein, partial [Candidatus Paceibacterota bacterium]|nr:Ig-like domain-containing protein [Candidatus Paceibacterota bacterium]